MVKEKPIPIHDRETIGRGNPVTTYKLSEEEREAILNKYGPPKDDAKIPPFLKLTQSEGENMKKGIKEAVAPELLSEEEIKELPDAAPVAEVPKAPKPVKKPNRQKISVQELVDHLSAGRTYEQIAESSGYSVRSLKAMMGRNKKSKQKASKPEAPKVEKVDAPQEVRIAPLLRPTRLVGKMLEIDINNELMDIGCGHGEFIGIKKEDLPAIIAELQELQKII